MRAKLGWNLRTQVKVLPGNSVTAAYTTVFNTALARTSFVDTSHEILW
jgi:hypothetical protein